jgi:DNA-binding GntR family transcriptional regulator
MATRPSFEDIPRRLSDQVASFLREEIYGGHLRPGERLLELELCERLDVSRAPLREALLALQNEGLVEVRPHRGATVVEFSEDDIREVFALRRILDPFAARAAAEREDPDSLQALRQALAGIENALERREGIAVALAHAEFHRVLGRASGLPRLAAFIDSLCTQMLASHALGTAEHLDLAATIVPDHLAIVEAISKGDAELAEQATREHFRPVEPMIESYRRLREGAVEEVRPTAPTGR